MHEALAVLGNLCVEHTFAAKALVVRYRSVAQQLLDCLARRGVPQLRLAPHSPESLARELVQTELDRQGVQLLSEDAVRLMVQRLLAEQAPRAAYLGMLEANAAVAAAVARSVLDVRSARAETDCHEQFEVVAKGVDFGNLRAAYERELDERRMLDSPGLFQFAADWVGNNRGAVRELLVCVPADPELTLREHEFLTAFPNLQQLPALAAPADAHRWTAPAGADKLTGPNEPTSQQQFPFMGVAGQGRIPGRSLAPEASAESTNGPLVLRAAGPACEIREMLRMCVERGWTLDQVELLSTDFDYTQLVFELGHLLPGEGDGEEERPLGEMPVTFAEGIPASYSTAGRMLRQWVAWLNHQYPQKTLLEMLDEGLLKLTKTGQSASSIGELAGALRSVNIGSGRERYLAQIDGRISELKRREAEAAGAGGAADGIAGATAGAKRLKTFRALKRFVRDLLGYCEDARTGGVELLDAARRLVDERSRTISPWDAAARLALLKAITAYRDDLQRVDAGDRGSAWAFLAELPASLKVGSEGPRPGRLHVAPIEHGGFSGRPVRLIVGLDESRFPRQARQDPILLDEERRRLGPALKTSHARTARALAAFRRLTSEPDVQLVLSYSCWDPASERERFPSSELVSLLHEWGVVAEASLEYVDQFLGEPVGYSSPRIPWSETDWWWAQLAARGRKSERQDVTGAPQLPGARSGEIDVAAGEAAWITRYPHWRQGWFAEAERDGGRLTKFDGYVPEAGSKFAPYAPEGHVFSATGLEKLGSCPLAWYFRYGLHVEPVDDHELDPDVWLDPLQFGTLIHDAFRDFMAGVREQQSLPDVESGEQRRLLAEILRRHVDGFRDQVPPPNEHVFRQQLYQLEKAAVVFLENETKHCREYLPRYFEVALGMPPDPAQPTDIDRLEPVAIALPDGQAIRVRGRIDRIDQLQEDPNVFEIWDYKSGKSARYRGPRLPFDQGRVVQNVLYMAAVEPVLRSTCGAGARARRFGYFFPGTRAWGERISWDRETLLAPGLAVVQQLVQLVHGGVFSATNNPDDCSFCDYRVVCGDVQRVCARSEQKLAEADPLLQPLRELRKGK